MRPDRKGALVSVVAPAFFDSTRIVSIDDYLTPFTVRGIRTDDWDFWKKRVFVVFARFLALKVRKGLRKL